MNISVIGADYIGLVIGACLAELGLNVLCMDIDEEKINLLKIGILPIYEPNLSEIILGNLNDRLHFTISIQDAVNFSDVIFLAVNTATLEDYTSDPSDIFKVVREIAAYVDTYKVIVNKSSIPVFTGQRIKEEIKAVWDLQGKQLNFDVVSNPEFLREGSAVEDFMNPDRIILGYENDKALEIMKKVYYIQLLEGVPFILTTIETAEMIKYASNAFLATKISFINEVANMCDLYGIDAVKVSKAMVLDERIGPKFLQPGPGYGGSYLPKDIRAFIGLGEKMRYTPKIVKSTVEVNRFQKLFVCLKIKKVVKKLSDKVITVLGLSFNPGTDDIIESPSIEIIKQLLKGNAKIKVYDPKAMQNMQKNCPNLEIQYCEDTYSACADSDCIVLFTDWKEFTELDFNRLKSIVRNLDFVDLKNVYEPEYVKSFGFRYEGMGRR